MDQLTTTIEDDAPNVEKMSRIELETFAQEHYETSQAAQAGLRDLLGSFENLQGLLHISASVDPDIIKGWRSWIARLDNERQKWLDKATSLSEQLQQQRQTEEERYAVILEENGQLHSLLTDAISSLGKILVATQEAHEALEDKVNKNSKGYKKIQEIADKALKTVQWIDKSLIGDTDGEATDDTTEPTGEADAQLSS